MTGQPAMRSRDGVFAVWCGDHCGVGHGRDAGYSVGYPRVPLSGTADDQVSQVGRVYLVPRYVRHIVLLLFFCFF